MRKDILGDWGNDLTDDDYGCALAALGILESQGTQQQGPSTDLRELIAAFWEDLKDGERTAIWRGAWNLHPGITPERWRETIHLEPRPLAEAWKKLLGEAGHPRRCPRLAVRAEWRQRPDLFDFDALLGWLARSETGCQAVLLASKGGGENDSIPAWHWPLRVGIPPVPGGEHLLDYLRDQRNGWIEDVTILQRVGEAREACDLLLLPPGGAAELAQTRLRLRASLVACLDDPPVRWNEAAEASQIALLRHVRAAGLVLVGKVDPGLWFEWLLRELAHDLPVHAALWGAGRYRTRISPVIVGHPASLDGMRLLTIAERLDRRLQLANRPSARPTVKEETHIIQEYLPEVDKESLRIDVKGDILTIRGERKIRFAAKEGHVRREMGKAVFVRRLPLPEGADAEDARASYGKKVLKITIPVKPPARPRRIEITPAAAPSPPPSLAEWIRERPFISETVDGKPIVDKIEQRRTEIESRRQLRWIQAAGWRPDSQERAFALAPEVPNILAIHIGPTTEHRNDAPFPDEKIDFSAGPVEAAVQLELAGAAVAALDEAAQREIGLSSDRHRFLLDDGPLAALMRFLPPPEPAEPGKEIVGVAGGTLLLPAAGPSSAALFAVRPQPGAAEVQGRIAVAYRNRIVQTARLTAAVHADPREGEGIFIAAEGVIHPRLDDLEERRDFDAGLMVADDIGGRLRLTVNRHGKAEEVQLENLKEAIAAIRQAVFEVARRTGDTLPLDSPSIVDVLSSLAANGRLLYDHLREGLGIDLDALDRLQLVSRGTAFFPLEYVYSGPRHRLDAALCPQAIAGLQQGNCGDCPHRGSTAHLCPLHFWGFSKVIERHGNAPASPGIRQQPSPTRTSFGHCHPVLFAASDKAFKFKKGRTWRKELLKSLHRLGNNTPPGEAKTWDDWRQQVKGTGPKILVMLPHADTARINVEVLEIGAGALLGKHEIADDLIGPPQTVQLVLLIGCSTADVQRDFAPYPEKFRSAGADIIIAPVAPIRGADAVPIARSLAESLADRLDKGQEVAFGELLRDVRRKLLADGYPGVLGLVGFGDADWLFGGTGA